MLLGIGGDRDLEIADRLRRGDEIGGRSIAVGSGFVGRVEAGRRIAAQRDDVAHAGFVIVAKRLVDLAARGADAGQMRRGLHRRFAHDALDRRMGALARRAAGAIGDRDETGLSGSSRSIASHKVRLHLLGLGREELERDLDRRAGAAEGDRFRGHQANSRRRFGKASEMTRGSSASQNATVSLPASPLAGGTTLHADAGEPRLGKIALDLVDREAEAAMRELLAQEFLVVGVEIDDMRAARPAAAPAPPRQRAGGIVEEVQHLMDDDEIVGVALDRRRVDVALAQLRRVGGPPDRCGRAPARASPGSGRRRPRASRAGRAARACGRCRCRDRADRGTASSPIMSTIAASTRSSGACSARIWSQSAARAAK